MSGHPKIVLSAGNARRPCFRGLLLIGEKATTMEKEPEMLGRYHFLLPVPAVLVALSACDSTATPAPEKKINCPSPTSLEKQVKLPEGTTFATVYCSKDWAGADPEPQTPGDAYYVFHYKPDLGWEFYGEGSEFDCEALGMPTYSPFCSTS